LIIILMKAASSTIKIFAISFFSSKHFFT